MQPQQENPKITPAGLLILLKAFQQDYSHFLACIRSDRPDLVQGAKYHIESRKILFTLSIYNIIEKDLATEASVRLRTERAGYRDKNLSTAIHNFYLATDDYQTHLQEYQARSESAWERSMNYVFNWHSGAAEKRAALQQETFSALEKAIEDFRAGKSCEQEANESLEATQAPRQ